MLITAKATPDDKIKEKINKGFNFVEIQLISENVSDANFFNTISYDIDVISVHTPLSDNIDIEVNHIFNEKYYNMFYNTCVISQKYANYYNHDIIVILHNGLQKSNWEDNKVLIDKLTDMFKKIIKEFPNLKFAIENTTPYSGEGTEIEDAVYIAKSLNYNLQTDKFGVVIDICHLIMTKRHKEMWLKKYPKLLNTKSFEDSFNESDGLLFILHLNNCIDMGYEKDHGTPFEISNENDLILLEDVLKQYIKYGNEAIICLEVREEDYSNCINIVKTYESLCYILNKLNYNGKIVK